MPRIASLIIMPNFDKKTKKLPQKVIIQKIVVSLHLKTKHKKMTKVKIEEVQKTDIAGLFTICFEGDDATEFQKFIEKFKEDATRKEDLSVILTAINRMLTASGFLERYFRPEGKMGDHVVALPIERTRMRLYCPTDVGQRVDCRQRRYEKHQDLRGGRESKRIRHHPATARQTAGAGHEERQGND